MVIKVRLVTVSYTRDVIFLVIAHNLFSILIYISHPQEVSEQSTHYTYKSKLMVDTLDINFRQI
jgi:hypothetical protein